MNLSEKILLIVKILRENSSSFSLPLINAVIEEYGKDSYLILVACLLSLRARDSTTIHVVRNLFIYVKSPLEMVNFPLEHLEKIIFKAVYYKQKALTLKFVSTQLLEKHGGEVPSSYQELTDIKGIGPKTAQLVLGTAFDVPAVCVDTHVHRISNRLGLVHTKTVEETQKALEQLLPKKLWTEWNFLLVMWGQNICLPLYPKCSACPLFSLCDKVGVKAKTRLKGKYE